MILLLKTTFLISSKMAAGNYEINFDATNLASGTYFYKFQFENIILTMKMLLLK